MARGEHLYVNRYGGFYSHHGIDCGDGSVIHFGAPDWFTERSISRISLEKFARGDKVQVRDYSAFFEALEKSRKPRGDILDTASFQVNRLLDSFRGLSVKELDISEEAVIARAESRLGETNFNLFFNNCEHFASWCVTGISNSDQIVDVWRAALPPMQFMKFATQSWLTDKADHSRFWY